MAARIAQTFKQLRQTGKKAFIAFLTAGFPDLKTTAQLVVSFEQAGVDLIELGIPFSDPIADGPVIQQASFEALRKHTTLAAVLKMVAQVRAQGVKIPLCFMSYYNPILAYGVDRFVRDAKASGVDGVIIPDMPFEESRVFSRLARKAGLDVILFVAPTTDKKRQAAICRSARGFIYYVCVAGVTGQRSKLPADVASHVRLLKSRTKTPVCVGFGISTPQQVKEIQRCADGAIVGSAIIKKIIACNGQKNLVQRVAAYVRTLKG